MLRKTFILALISFMAFNLQAQISFGGTPPSFEREAKAGSVEAIVVPVNFDAEAQIALDLFEQEDRGTPPRFAEHLDVHYSMNEHAVWTNLDDGRRIGRLRLIAKGAKALILTYSRFEIPEGDRLFIYSADRSHVLGAYTHKTHPRSGAFSTRMVAGDDLVLEYVQAASSSEANIVIDGIGYCYNHVYVHREEAKIGESGGCMVNINCSPEGDGWQTEKKGVVQIQTRLNSGWNICSGTMVNNTAQDRTPYFLSAYHCYDGALDEHMLLWQFNFHFESPGCRTENPLDTKTLVGCTVRTAIPLEGGSDGLLLELLDSVPEDWDVYFNGWDRRDESVAGRGVSIHHPAGDIKKISTYDKYETGTWVSAMYGTGMDDAHWLMSFVATANGHGVTEGGSSGSPIFTPEGLVMGSLTGGNSSCGNPNGSNFYGKMSYHWDRYGDSPQTQMKTWLDPLDSGVETLNGIFFDPVAPRLSLDVNSLELDGQVGEDNPVKTIAIAAYNLTETVTASVEGEFELSLDKVQWSSDLQMPSEGGNLYVRYRPLTIGYDNGTITLSSLELSNVKYPREYTVSLTANSCLDIFIENADMPHGRVGDDYSLQLTAAGSEGPYVFELVSGGLPEGLSFDNGLIEGKIMEDGTFNASVSITDKFDCTTIHDVNLYVICDIVSQFPYHEDFEAEDIPSCWKESQAKGTVAWQFASGVRPEYEDVATAQNGNRNAVFYDSSYDGNATRLITPQLDLSGVNSPELTFWYMMPAWGEDLDELTVVYKTSAHSDWKLLGAYTEETTGWTEAKVSLPEPSAEYFIAFEALSHYGYGIGIDNMIVKDGSVGIDITASNDMNIRFNNPVHGKLTVKWEDDITSLTLFSITGNRVCQIDQAENKNNVTIDMSAWPKGIYLLKAESRNNRKTFKIINN